MRVCVQVYREREKDVRQAKQLQRMETVVVAIGYSSVNPEYTAYILGKTHTNVSKP